MAADNKASSPCLAALKQMADDELAALKALYARRESAARRCEATTAALAEAVAAKARGEQQAAIDDLLDAGMSAASVAELFGINQRQVRPSRPSRPSRPFRSSRRAASPTEEAQPVSFSWLQPPPAGLSVVA